jgi:integrase
VRHVGDTFSPFRKIGECLYRYSPNGVYYARIKSSGKEIRRSLQTTDRETAKRKLARLREEQTHIDRSRGKLTLHELCGRYIKTVQHYRPSTVAQKALIIRRMQDHWPSGAQTQVSKIQPSDVELWLSQYSLGPSSRNLHIVCIKQVFEMALRDSIISRSPAAHLRWTKRATPIRKTPSFAEFEAIVESIRSQKFNGHDAEESADFVQFLGLAGLGQAEAGSLTQGDIDWERETITTFRHKTKSGFAIPLYPQVKPLLLKRRRRDSPSCPVFMIKDAKKAIAAACHRLKLPLYSQRSFRRMFITRAIERGVDVKVIAEWQGHKDGGKLILDTYSYVNRAHSRQMAQLMRIDEPSNIMSIGKEGAV